jgi:phosphatidylserine decarboxylase
MGENILSNQPLKSIYLRSLSFFALALNLVPKNMLSWTLGSLVRINWPRPLQAIINRGFVTLFSIDISEAEKPLSQFHSIEEIFTRPIRLELRPISAPLCSPADGTLICAGPIADGQMRVKDVSYHVSDLIFGESAEPRQLDAHWALTVYLAPHNYHRVHAPLRGALTRIRYIPGELWPVNPPFVARVPRLFVRNERLIFDMETESGAKAYIVMVGALNVGRIYTPFKPGFFTNDTKRQLGAPPQTYSCRHSVECGEELGIFMLGSTVVVVLDKKAYQELSAAPFDSERPILMGQGLSL